MCGHVAVCWSHGSPVQPELRYNVTTLHKYGDNDESSAPTKFIALVTEPLTMVTKPVTVVTAPLMKMTEPVTVATKPLTAVTDPVTSVEPAIASSGESGEVDHVDVNVTSTSTPLVTMTTSDVATSPVVLSPSSVDPAFLSATEQVNGVTTVSVNVSASVSQSSTNTIDIMTVSPDMSDVSPSTVSHDMSSDVTPSVTSIVSPTTSVLLNVSSGLITSEVEVSTLPSDTLNMTAAFPDFEGSVTPLLSVSPTVKPPVSTPTLSPTVTLDNMTDVLVLTSIINVSATTPAITVDTVSLLVDTTPSSTGPDIVTTPSDRVYKLTFDGNCSLLELPGFKQQFVKVLSSLIKIKFKIKDENLKIHKEITCGSLIVKVGLFNLTDPSFDAKMETMANSSVALNVTTGNITLFISLLKVANIRKSELTLAGSTTTETPTSEQPALNQIDKFIVIVFSIVGGTLLIFGVVYVMYICCARKHKSFDLGDTPTANVHLEDFTLTKMTRSHPMYSDQGMVISLESNAANSDLKPGNVYQGHQGHFPGTTVPPLSTFKSSETFEPQRLVAVSSMDASQDMGLTHGSAENLTKIPHRASTTQTGFDNPSFSSEDVLDSGTDDNVEDLQQLSGLNEGATPF